MSRKVGLGDEQDSSSSGESSSRCRSDNRAEIWMEVDGVTSKRQLNTAVKR
jgi:hypothetical protein